MDVPAALCRPAAVVVVLQHVRVSGEDMHVVEVVLEGAHYGRLGIGIAAGCGTERCVDAKDDKFRCGTLYPGDIGPEPVNLFAGETFAVIDGRITGGAGSVAAAANDIIHHDDVGIADVEGVIGGSESVHEGRFGIVIGGLCRVVVVVADGIEHRNIETVGKRRYNGRSH